MNTFKEFKVNDKEYKLILNAYSIVEAEKRLGHNILNVLTSLSGDNLPTLESILIILWASLQKYQHGMKLEDAYDIYDNYIAEGHQFADIIPEIVDIFEVSGFFKKEDKSKNAKKREK